jgi:phosphoglycerol transferase
MRRLLAGKGTRACAGYLGALALCLVILAGVMRLWRADLAVPFYYKGDSIFHQVWVKGLVDNGWFLHNAYVGMPTGLDIHDYPMSESLHFGLMKLIGLFTADPVIILNVYFLCGFPLTTLTGLFVLRRLGISYAPALAVSLLYTFLPYHFIRGEGHLFLAAYYLVPLSLLAAVWIYTGDFVLFRRDEEGRRRWAFFHGKGLLCLGVCLLVSSATVYYAFFACFFLLAAGAAASLARKKAIALGTAVLGVLVIAGGLLVNIYPSIAYRLAHGANPEAVVRQSVETEIYGLKIAQLLLPVKGHRLPPLAELKAHYNNAPMYLVNDENDSSSLGVVGGVGFVLLLGWFFWSAVGRIGNPSAQGRDGLPIRPTESGPVPSALGTALAVLCVSGLLLATVGGFGSLFGLLFTPWIRAYARISIFLAFLAFAAIALTLDRAARACAAGPRPRWLFHGALAVGLVLGLLDITTEACAPEYARLQEEYHSDAGFVARVEAAVPEGAMVFQLPVRPFFEHTAVCKMNHYDLFRGYLHSRRLRWSYGAIKGRAADLWQRSLAGKPVGQLAEALSLAGFAGVYVDRYAYPDMAAHLESELSGVLDAAPLVSANGRLSFFPLARYTGRLRRRYSPREWESRQEEVLHPLVVSWSGGFYDQEGSGEKTWRWCPARGELHLHNLGRHDRRVRLEMSFRTGDAGPARLHISGDLVSEKLAVDYRPAPWSRTVTVPPGTHVLRFYCTAKKLDLPSDERTLVFQVEDCRIHAVAGELAFTRRGTLTRK